MASDIVVPIVAIFLGFGVVLIRPADRNVWILLCLMISFAEVSRNSQMVRSGIHGDGCPGQLLVYDLARVEALVWHQFPPSAPP